MGWVTFWAIFFTNSSGRPASPPTRGSLKIDKILAPLQKPVRVYLESRPCLQGSNIKKFYFGFFPLSLSHTHTHSLFSAESLISYSCAIFITKVALREERLEREKAVVTKRRRNRSK
jgi:hypothetical protein